MWIIVAYLAFCWVIGNSRLNMTKKGAVLICFVGAFIMGFRSVDFTGDNLAYATYYNINANYTIAESWNKVVSNSGKDPFYYFVGNVFSKIGFTYREWFILISLIYMAGFCMIMYRHSKNYFISGLVLIALSYYYFAMTGVRQALAIGLCFFALEFAYQKKLIPFIIIVLLAAQFHSSALIFILVYALGYIKPGLKFFFAIGIASLIALLEPSAISYIIGKLAWNDQLAGYAEVTEGLTVTGFLIQFALIIFCYIIYVGKLNQYKSVQSYNESVIPHSDIFFDQIAMNMMFVGAIFQTFAINTSNIFRMSMYFSIAVTWLLPNTIYSQQDIKNRQILYYLVTVLLFIYFLIGPIGHFTNLTLFGEL